MIPLITLSSYQLASPIPVFIIIIISTISIIIINFYRFIHPSTGQESHAYRITYRHMDRSLTNAEINEIQQSVRQKLEDNLKVVLR